MLKRLQARARRVHQPQAAGARRRPPGFAAKADFLIMEEKFKAFQKKELKFGSKPEQIKKVFEIVHQRGEGAQRGLPEDLELQGRDLDAGVVPAHGRRLLRVRAEADQGGRQPARRPQEARQAGLQGQPGRLRRRRGAVQGRHLPVRHARSRTRPRSAGRTRWRARRSSASRTTTSRRRARTSRSTCPTSSRSSRTSASDWSTRENGTSRPSARVVCSRRGLAGGGLAAPTPAHRASASRRPP